MPETTRHFTTEVFIVHKNKVLLHKHKKLGHWFPPGGHIDRDELPTDSALREVNEETGLDIELYNPDKLVNDPPQAIGLIRPAHIMLEQINEFHQHIDFVYYGKSASDKISPGKGESKTWKWFSIKELQSEEILENVRQLGIEAINKIS
jgi:8-oxo-dGTP pyrophosphatase MutT (NUDIX family)